MRNDVTGAQPGQFARQGAACKLALVPRFAIDHLTVVFLPALDEVRDQNTSWRNSSLKCVGSRERSKSCRHKTLPGVMVQGTDQQLMLDQLCSVPCVTRRTDGARVF